MRKAAKITLCFIFLASTAMPLRAQQNSPTDSIQRAEVEAVRRQEATREMRMKLADAQAAQKNGRLGDAARLYQEAVGLFARVQTGNEQVEADKKTALAGYSSVRLELARQAYDRGNLSEASEELTAALKLYPKNESLLAAKLEFDKAAEARKGRVPSPDTLATIPALQKDRIEVSTLVQNGKFLYEAGKYDDAEVKLKEALKRDPNNRAAYYYMDLVKEARFMSDSRARETTAKGRIADVTKGWIPDRKNEGLQVPNPVTRTNLTYTGKGRQEIMQKLDRIRIDEVAYDLPLGEVLKLLRDESKKRDPDGVGINFMINNRVDPADTGSIDPMAMIGIASGGNLGGQPGQAGRNIPPAGLAPEANNPNAAAAAAAPEAPKTLDMYQVSIKINPPLVNLRLAEVLDVLTKVSDQPIKYTIEDYAVFFSPKTPEPAQLYSKTFQVDPNTFIQGLESVSSTILADIGSGTTGNGGGGGGNSGGQNGGQGSGSVEMPQVSLASGGHRATGAAGGQQVGNGGQNGGGGLLGPHTDRGLAFVTTTHSTIELHQMVRLYFTAAGVNLLGQGKSVFFNDRSGTLLVRATLQDLEIIETAINALNKAPTQITIEAKFAEISQDDSRALGFDWFLGNTLIGDGSAGIQSGTAPSYQGSPSTANPSGVFPGPAAINANGTMSASPATIAPSATDGLLTGGLRNSVGSSSVPAVATITGILTDPQFRVVIKAIEQRSGSDVLSAPKVTTLSGRQAHISVIDQVTLVTGVNVQQTGSGSSGTALTTGNGAVASAITYTTQSAPFGPVLDVLPTLSSDGYSIQMVLIPTITEFVGYDNPGQFVTQAQSVGGSSSSGNTLIGVLPLPRMRVRQVVTTCSVWDGQTVVLGGLISENVQKIKDKVPLLGDIPYIGRLFRSESSSTTKKNLMVFVTPTLIDPAGNRLHTDEELPFARNSIPPQAMVAPVPTAAQ